MSRQPLIAGIDPGSTSAVAALNLDREVVLLKSQRDMTDSEIIRSLVDHGKTVVVATDKAKTPSKVDRIAGKLGARRFNPPQDLEKSRKHELGDGANSHEKDALASAINAHKQLSRTIRKVKKKADSSEKSREQIASEYFTEGLRNNKIK